MKNTQKRLLSNKHFLLAVVFIPQTGIWDATLTHTWRGEESGRAGWVARHRPFVGSTGIWWWQWHRAQCSCTGKEHKKTRLSTVTYKTGALTTILWIPAGKKKERKKNWDIMHHDDMKIPHGIPELINELLITWLSSGCFQEAHSPFLVSPTGHSQPYRESDCLAFEAGWEW